MAEPWDACRSANMSTCWALVVVVIDRFLMFLHYENNIKI